MREGLDQPESPCCVDIRVVKTLTAESLQHFAEMLHWCEEEEDDKEEEEEEEEDEGWKVSCRYAQTKRWTP